MPQDSNARLRTAGIQLTAEVDGLRRAVTNWKRKVEIATSGRNDGRRVRVRGWIMVLGSGFSLCGCLGGGQFHLEASPFPLAFRQLCAL